MFWPDPNFRTGASPILQIAGARSQLQSWPSGLSSLVTQPFHWSKSERFFCSFFWQGYIRMATLALIKVGKKNSWHNLAFFGKATNLSLPSLPTPYYMFGFAKSDRFCQSAQFGWNCLFFLYCCSFWQEYSPFPSPPCWAGPPHPLYQVPRHHCTATLKRGAGGGGEKKLKSFSLPFWMEACQALIQVDGRRKKGDWSARCVLTSSYKDIGLFLLLPAHRYK